MWLSLDQHMMKGSTKKKRRKKSISHWAVCWAEASSYQATSACCLKITGSLTVLGYIKKKKQFFPPLKLTKDLIWRDWQRCNRSTFYISGNRLCCLFRFQCRSWSHVLINRFTEIILKQTETWTQVCEFAEVRAEREAALRLRLRELWGGYRSNHYTIHHWQEQHWRFAICPPNSHGAIRQIKSTKYGRANDLFHLLQPEDLLPFLVLYYCKLNMFGSETFLYFSIYSTDGAISQFIENTSTTWPTEKRSVSGSKAKPFQIFELDGWFLTSTKQSCTPGFPGTVSHSLPQPTEDTPFVVKLWMF